MPLTNAQADDLADLVTDFPGVNIRCDGRSWTAETDRYVLHAGAADSLRDMLAQSTAGHSIGDALRLVRAVFP